MGIQNELPHSLYHNPQLEQLGRHPRELPSTRAIKRFEANGFRVLEAHTIWGDLWAIQQYSFMFDSEYQERSNLIKALVILSKVLSVNVLVQETLNVVLNAVSAIVERRTPLDNRQGLMIVCQKV